MENKITFSWNGYWQPTPALIRKVADSLMIGLQFAGGYIAIGTSSHLGIALMISGTCLKVISNFFTDNPPQ